MWDSLIQCQESSAPCSLNYFPFPFPCSLVFLGPWSLYIFTPFSPLPKTPCRVSLYTEWPLAYSVSREAELKEHLQYWPSLLEPLFYSCPLSFCSFFHSEHFVPLFHFLFSLFFSSSFSNLSVHFSIVTRVYIVSKVMTNTKGEAN